MGKKFEAVYEDAPDNLVNALAAFREAHPVKTVISGGHEWEYGAGGVGDETILFLHGVGANKESHFMQITALEQDFHVIAPTIPGITEMQTLASGLAALLDAEVQAPVHVMGVSFGGMVAQAFLHSYPARVHHLIASHTMIPRPSAAEDFKKQRNMTRLLPGFVYASAARAAGIQSLEADVPDLTEDEKAFWKANFDELYPDGVSKDMFVGRLEAGIDYQLNLNLHSGGPDNWDGSVLIIESAKDTVIPAQDRNAIKKHYPTAEVVTVEQYGHMGALARLEPTMSAVQAFLSS